VTVELTVTAGQPALAQAAVECAAWQLLDRQDEDGCWGSVRLSSIGMDAEEFLYREVSGIRTRELTDATARGIRRRQNPDGSWPAHERGAGDLGVSVLVYVVLRLAGDSSDAYHMALAAGWIRDAGGLAASGFPARIWLAAFGQVGWEEIPVPPPEAIYLPASCPVRLPGQAGWGRPTVIPLAVMAALRPVRWLPFSLAELRPPVAASTSTGKAGLDRSLQWYQRSLHVAGLGGARGAALRKCGEWVISAQQQDGSWRGSTSGWLFSLIALQLLGHCLKDEVLARGVAALDSAAVWTTEGGKPVRRLQLRHQSVVDTGLAVRALLDAGVPASQRALLAATDWLQREEASARSEWLAGRRELRPGAVTPAAGVDETAWLIQALHRTAKLTGAGRLPATASALRWLGGMQRTDGGWGQFAAEPSSAVVSRLPLVDSGDAGNASCAEPTATAVEALATAARPGSPPIRRGVAWLLRAQLADGSWPDALGSSSLSATCAVLPALVEAGVITTKAPVRLAVRWLLEQQNPEDGGWSDSASVDGDPGSQRIDGRPVVSDVLSTARALRALSAAGSAEAVNAIERAVSFLIVSQRPDGTWQTPGAAPRAELATALLAVPLSAVGRYVASHAVASHAVAQHAVAQHAMAPARNPVVQVPAQRKPAESAPGRARSARREPARVRGS